MDEDGPRSPLRHLGQQWVLCLPALIAVLLALRRPDFWKPVWQSGRVSGGSFVVPAHGLIALVVVVYAANVLLSSSRLLTAARDYVNAGEDFTMKLTVGVARLIAFCAMYFLAIHNY